MILKPSDFSLDRYLLKINFNKNNGGYKKGEEIRCISTTSDTVTVVDQQSIFSLWVFTVNTKPVFGLKVK